MSEAIEGYYEKYYPDYILQNPSHKLDFYLDLLRMYVPPGKTIFELGTGKGLFLARASKIYQCAGCDINPEGIAETQKYVPSAQLMVGSVESIPDKIPQAVVSWDVLEHLPDLSTALSQIYTKLPAGGVLVAVVPVYDGPLGWLVHLLDKDPTHVTKESKEFWLNALAQSGFAVETWGGIVRKLVGKTYLHFVKPKFLLRWSGTAIYFVARKA